MDCEFVIIGNSPMAALLAGSLTKIHGRETALIGQFRHVLQPISGFDISFAPITRPQTLKLLQENIPILKDLLRDFSSNTPFETIDPLLIARTEHSKNALLHIKNVASHYGFIMEKQAHDEGILLSLQVRDITRIMRRSFFAGLSNWLKRHKIKHFATTEIEIKQTSRGGIKINGFDEVVFAKKIVFVDDEAILSNMNEQDLHNNFFKVATSSLMVEPINKIKNSTIILADEGAIIHQHKDRAIDFVANDILDNVYKVICDNLNGYNLRLAGKAQFISLASRDGAGIFGNISGKKISYIGGFGTSGAFLTPVMARILIGEGSEFEHTYFAARKPAKADKQRINIAEYCPLPAKSLS